MYKSFAIMLNSVYVYFFLIKIKQKTKNLKFKIYKIYFTVYIYKIA